MSFSNFLPVPLLAASSYLSTSFAYNEYRGPKIKRIFSRFIGLAVSGIIFVVLEYLFPLIFSRQVVAVFSQSD
jgi:hypothetical protein